MLSPPLRRSPPLFNPQQPLAPMFSLVFIFALAFEISLLNPRQRPASFLPSKLCHANLKVISGDYIAIPLNNHHNLSSFFTVLKTLAANFSFLSAEMYHSHLLVLADYPSSLKNRHPSCSPSIIACITCTM